MTSFLTTRALPILAAATLVCSGAYADELHLDNGDRISGTLVRLTPEMCTFETAYGGTLDIEPGRITRLVTTESVAVRLEGGDRVVGFIDLDPNGSLFVHSARFGVLRLEMTEVTAVSRDPDSPPAPGEQEPPGMD